MMAPHSPSTKSHFMSLLNNEGFLVFLLRVVFLAVVFFALPLRFVGLLLLLVLREVFVFFVFAMGVF